MFVLANRGRSRSGDIQRDVLGAQDIRCKVSCKMRLACRWKSEKSEQQSNRTWEIYGCSHHSGLPFQTKRSIMQADIRRLGGINLYFPYLDTKNGNIASLRSELGWVVAYSWFADKLIFPPRSIFSGKYALQNLSDLINIPLLRCLTDAGVLITTATNPNFRDLNDLFEYYSGLTSRSQQGLSEFSIYTRDEAFQKRLVAEYTIERIEKFTEMAPLDKKIITSIASEMPNQSCLVSRVSSVLEGAPLEIKRNVSKILTTAYFFAGAKGNAAIMPPHQWRTAM